ncbi:MAG: symmetrical bis(5'-nucleosyl)-tetraphosphatase [Betaproteobacteria bacterium]
MLATDPTEPISKDSPWVIGDLQGCLDPLLELVEKLPEKAPIWLTGDLINRGPQSLETLRWVIAQGARVRTVLGNHDLHLLAIALGVRKPHRSDTYDDILNATDRADLIDWLRSQPLAHREHGWLMVHAGVLPQWTAAQTVVLAQEVSARLQAPDWTRFIPAMYGTEPSHWSETLTGDDRLRVVVNALTRLRFCDSGGRMEFATKEGVGAAPPSFMPWFEVPDRATAGVPLVFGHWSALGLINRPDLIAIDTGCVWGRQLSAVRLADRAVIQVQCADCGAGGG